MSPARAHPARTAVWSAIVALAVLGFVASAGRGWGVIDSVTSSDKAVPEISRLDRLGILLLATLTGIDRDSAAWAEVDAQNRAMLGKFNRHPVVTLLHVLPAALFMVLAPLQFSSRLRTRVPLWHRWSGRLLVAFAIPVGISGLWFGIVMPFSGLVESSAIALAGALFLGSAARGFVAIRRRDVARHREWMIRFCSIAFGVSVVRLVGIALALLTLEGPEVWFGPSLWIGFAISAAAGEIWIRQTRRLSGGEAYARPVLAGGWPPLNQ